jgi:two-component system, chemotaxis family, sensor histidine kinase and response regulator PixL
MNDANIQAQAYSYFLAEAPELLQTIEHEILTLPSEHTTAKVHNLMRALHTLKGAAANVGLSAIERIAHDFEDVTRVFYDLDVTIDLEIQTLLLDGYTGLQACLSTQITTGADLQIDELEIVERMAETIEKLKLKLGDWSETEIALPSSIELGFDIVESIFETTIQEQIDELIAVITTQDPERVADCLRSVADISSSLAESFELPGFLEIARAIIAAIDNYPDLVNEIAPIALAHLQQAQADVLAGDRTVGGRVSSELATLAQEPVVELDLIPDVEVEVDISPSGEAELPAFQAFLQSDLFRKRHAFSADNQYLFDRIVRLCWDWFRHEIQPLPTQLNLEILVASDGLADLDYIHHWVGLLLQGLSPTRDRDRLYLYQQCCIYQVVFAVAKYLAGTEPNRQFTAEFLTELRLHLQSLVDTYKQGSPVTANERGWIDRIILPHHWVENLAATPGEDLLLNEVWGQLDFGNNA